MSYPTHCNGSASASSLTLGTSFSSGSASSCGASTFLGHNIQIYDDNNTYCGTTIPAAPLYELIIQIGFNFNLQVHYYLKIEEGISKFAIHNYKIRLGNKEFTPTDLTRNTHHGLQDLYPTWPNPVIGTFPVQNNNNYTIVTCPHTAPLTVTMPTATPMTWTTYTDEVYTEPGLTFLTIEELLVNEHEIIRLIGQHLAKQDQNDSK